MSVSFHRKIVDLARLRQVVGLARADGKTIVQCHGCFDIVHPGHIRYLEFARRQGDVLIVSLTGDSDVDKGGDRPYIPEDLRAENLAALEFVDAVYINPSPTAEPVLKAVTPDVYVKGHEYERSEDTRFLAEKRVVEETGGRIIFSSGDVVFSSTKLVGRLSAGGEAASGRLELLCSRYDLTRSSITDALDGFRSLYVLVVGDAVLDRYVFCDAVGVASESPMLSLSYLGEETYVGGAAIVARHIRAMGGRPFLVAGVGGDQASRYVREKLDQEGIECHLIESRSALPQKTRYLADESKLVKIDRAEHQPLDSRHEAEAARVLEQQAAIADAVVFCDFGCGTVTGGLLGRTLPMLRHNVRTIAADVSGARANLLNFKHVDLLCPTEREVRAALNDYDSGLSTVAWNLLDRTQAKHLIVTLEKRGLVVFMRRSRKRGTPEWSARLTSEALPSFAQQTIDRLGCGDAMLAASTLALAAGASLTQSAYISNAAAAVELSMLGNKPVSIDHLRSWLSGRPELVTLGGNRTGDPREIGSRNCTSPTV